jgi:hypothetical protein
MILYEVQLSATNSGVRPTTAHIHCKNGYPLSSTVFAKHCFGDIFSLRGLLVA